MNGLPSDWYGRCREVLKRCSEFQSNESLRVVFVTEGLAAYRNGLPEASSIDLRVDQCLAYLLDKSWREQSVLVLFLETLRDRYPEDDEQRDRLDQLAHEIQEKLTSSPPSRVAPSTNAASKSPDPHPPFPKADVLLVTVTETEAKAVLALFPESKPYYGQIQTYYDLGLIGEARIFMVQSEMGQSGQSGAILSIQEGIDTLHPSAVIMIGIAFGVDKEKQHIGDILVSRQIVDYELQRVGTEKDGGMVIIPRGDRPSASPRMLSRFRAATNYWQAPPAIHFGLILSGAKLVDNQDFREQLLSFEPEAIGGEMEGAGLYAVAQRRKIDWIVVKAICDWADGNKNQDKGQNQRTAAENAAHFTIYVINKGGFAESKQATTFKLM